MPRFTYIARSTAGERVEGSVEANERRGALQQIERKGLVPVSVQEVGAAKEAPRAPAAARPAPATPAAPVRKDKPTKGSSSFTGRKPRLRLREVLLFNSEMSDLITSGMTLGRALNALSRRKAKRGQDQIMAALRDDIVKGDSLSEALSRHPESFSDLYVSMIRAGEASGKLSEALGRLTSHYERVLEAREKVGMALIYPAIVMGVSVLTMIFTMTVVVPKFARMFAELGSTMPLPTRMLMALSSLLLKWGWLMLIVIVAGVIYFRRYIRTPPGRLFWDRLLLRVPVVRNVVSANAFAQFASTLAALLQNGVPVLQALSIVEETIGNVVIGREIREARTRVTDGSTISGPLAAGQVFPTLLTDMLAVGEETGDMAGALTHIARRYHSELDRQVKVFTTVLEPLMIVVMAGMVGFIAISMLLAVFDLTSGLNIK